MEAIDIFLNHKNSTIEIVEAKRIDYEQRMAFINSLLIKFQNVYQGNAINVKLDHITFIDIIKAYYYFFSVCEKRSESFDTVFPIEFCSLVDKYSFLEIVEMLQAYNESRNGNIDKLNNLPQNMQIIIKHLIEVFEKDVNVEDKYILRMISVFQSYYICGAKNNMIGNQKDSKLQIADNARDTIGIFCQSCNLLKKQYQEFLDIYAKWLSESKVLFDYLEDAIINHKPFKFSPTDAKTIPVDFAVEIYKILLDIQKGIYNNLKDDQGNNLEETLSKFGITISESDKQLLSSASLEYINEVLTELKTIGFDFSKTDIINILINTSKDNLLAIIRLIKKGIISLEVAYEYPNIFNNGANGLFDQLMANYNIIKQYCKDSVEPSYQVRLINTPSSIIMNNIASSQYYISVFIKTNPLLFILNPQMNLIADYLIENYDNPETICLDNLIDANLSLVLQRIVVAREVGIDIIVSGKIADAIITGNKFIVPEHLLNDYVTAPEDMQLLLNPNLKGNELLEYLNSVYLADNVYNFNGVNVSRARFMRNISHYPNVNSDSIYKAILTNGYYSDVETEKIHKAVYSMVK